VAKRIINKILVAHTVQAHIQWELGMIQNSHLFAATFNIPNKIRKKTIKEIVKSKTKNSLYRMQTNGILGI